MQWKFVTRSPLSIWLRRPGSINWRPKKVLRALGRAFRKVRRASSREARTDTKRKSKTLRTSLRMVFDRATLKALPQPPYPHLLCSNESPSEDEVQCILRSLSIAETMLETISNSSKSTPPTTRRQQSIIARRVSYLQDFISSHRATLNPIRRLPVEIIQSIMMFVFVSRQAQWRDHIDYNPTLYLNILTIPPVVPWELGHICRHWRRVALSYPQLWSQLRLSWLDQKMRPSRLAAFREQLTRTKGGPFRFGLQPRNLSKLNPSASRHPILDTLLARSDDWVEARIMVASPYVDRFTQPREPLQSLRHLALAFASMSGNSAVPFPKLSYFASAPQLTQVELSTNQYTPVDIDLPWAQLERLSLHSPAAAFLPQIGQCSQLVALTIVGKRYMTFNTTSLPKLKELSLRVDRALIAIHYLSNITAPKLESLHITFNDTIQDPILHNDFVRSLIGTITPAQSPDRPDESNQVPPCDEHPPLLHFKLKIKNNSQPDFFSLGPFLERTARLTHLSLDYACQDDIAKIADLPTFLPCLIEIDLVLSQSPAKVHSLAECIKAVCETRAPKSSRLVPDHPDSDPPGRLRVFTINPPCVYLSELVDVWKAVENWKQTPGLTELQALKRRLADEIPACDPPFHAPPRKGFDLRTVFTDELGDRLARVEGIVDDFDELLSESDTYPITLTYHDVLGADVLWTLRYLGLYFRWEQMFFSGHHNHSPRTARLKYRFVELWRRLDKIHQDTVEHGRWFITPILMSGAQVRYIVDGKQKKEFVGQIDPYLRNLD